MELEKESTSQLEFGRFSNVLSNIISLTQRFGPTNMKFFETYSSEHTTKEGQAPPQPLMAFPANIPRFSASIFQ